MKFGDNGGFQQNLVFQLLNKRKHDTKLISLQFDVWATYQYMFVEADELLSLAC
jgi:hypothetical protein